MQEWYRSVWGFVAAGAALPLVACAAPASHMETGHGEASVKEGKPASDACPATRGWVAWVNAMPGPGMVPTLIVEGEVDLPAGKAAVLEQGPLDRMMPPGQRFALRIEAASVAGDQAGGWRKVRAELAPAQADYRAILIGCNGQALAEITSVTRAY